MGGLSGMFSFLLNIEMWPVPPQDYMGMANLCPQSHCCFLASPSLQSKKQTRVTPHPTTTLPRAKGKIFSLVNSLLLKMKYLLLSMTYTDVMLFHLIPTSV